MAKALTIQQFFKMFPDDSACLRHLFEIRFGANYTCPKCGTSGAWHRLTKLPAYTCNCGHHVHPMAGTPFLRTRTSLQKWFYAMYLFTTTRNGVAAKELQRQLGVTYKTAWRMAREIRIYMGWVDGDTPLGGPDGAIVEADKAFIGGHDKMGESDKTIVLGMVERGGEVLTRIIPDRRWPTVSDVIAEWVKPGSRRATDEASAFMHLAA
ncbi:MAG TPA: IS1595 family transposase, partial [Propylenella sp.]